MFKIKRRKKCVGVADAKRKKARKNKRGKCQSI